ncbi:phosphoadenosine phosphosulfate reductase family protein [Microbulbifer agarilyticus]|uniref:phosphoadenosine phosphosulfate reductase domain-containing protein n=1 Tax=Microbulbifer agarilyticus TaxID=260552 RepID=UPI001C940B50|nr:phosphoadenosine phosphosulfate reductase family protein [Microbulbifer agarilyticus]MBY6189180.1 phosphoadenosine phosphosulfate reductase family protein [Microbulbifer agarilyticus]
MQAVTNSVQKEIQQGSLFNSNLVDLNKEFAGAAPTEIIEFAIERSINPVIFTNFRPLATAFLHLVTQVKPNIPVIWVDHGYNTPETYRHLEAVVEALNLNLVTYSPKMSAAHYEAVYGGIPALDTPEHDRFSRIVKLEPFDRAMEDLKPDVWFNGIRHDQNHFRKNLNIFTTGSHNTIRVAPMYHLNELDVENYVYENELPHNEVYFDPTKGEEHRECGLMLK